MMYPTTQTLREKYAWDLQKYIAARVDGPAAEDVLQQVFLKVHNKLNTVKDQKKIKSRLYRTTQYTIIDWYRSERGGNLWIVGDEFRDQLESEEQSDRQKLVKQASSCLLPMIEDLDDTSRAVMQMYLDKQYTQADIADELWLNISNVKVIIHRSKKKLKAMYEQCCELYKDENDNIIDAWCNNECGCDDV